MRHGVLFYGIETRKDLFNLDPMLSVKLPLNNSQLDLNLRYNECQTSAVMFTNIYINLLKLFLYKTLNHKPRSVL